MNPCAIERSPPNWPMLLLAIDRLKEFHLSVAGTCKELYGKRARWYERTLGGCRMTILPRGRRGGIGAAAVVTAAVAFGVAISGATPAAARVFVGFGFGFPIGFPGYYYPPYPYPYYPPPPPPYYYPPAPGYSPPASYQPSGYPPSAGYGPSGSSAAPPITYTPRPGWTNAQGQYCREYKSTQSTGRSATERYGTACRDADGQWRIVN
jgi:hypothetical protein